MKAQTRNDEDVLWTLYKGARTAEARIDTGVMLYGEAQGWKEAT